MPNPQPPDNNASSATTDTTDATSQSKTARKRAAEQLQHLGQQLCDLNPAQLERLQLPEPLLKAIHDYQRFHAREAKRRQLQFIGRVMRDLLEPEDIDVINNHLQDLQGQSAAAQYQFQQLEHWRSALLAEDAAVTRFITTFPNVERQQLRQLVKSARRHATTHSDQEKTAARKLFRFLRDTIEAQD
ncbi:MAG: ribosome biogenesis factor YjgA [Pseudomonadota bacterium]